jgi:AcrR family transcriptional regulator
MASSDIRNRPAARTSVWLEEPPAPKRKSPVSPAATQGSGQGGGQAVGARGAEQQQDGLDREKITAVSVRLLDADGLAKFSMRRLAAELGVTAMSVYWYVQSKDDLLELALDAVEGELSLPDPDDASADWRDQLRQLAYGYRKMFNDHPWASNMLGSYLNVGPRAMDFVDTTRRIMERSGLPSRKLTGGISALFQFVYGFSTVEAHWNSRCREAGLATDEYHATVHAKIQGRPEYADTLRLNDERVGDTVEEMRERDFTVALDCIIAGIEAQREQGQEQEGQEEQGRRREQGHEQGEEREQGEPVDS